MHRESGEDGRGPPRTGPPCSGTPRGDPDVAPNDGAGTGPRSAAGRARVRAARVRHGGDSAEYQATLRRADAVIAEARALLAQFEAAAFRPNPARPPRLRLVGGVAWSGEQARRGGKTPAP
jgi:hypothetical protein